MAGLCLAVAIHPLKPLHLGAQAAVGGTVEPVTLTISLLEEWHKHAECVDAKEIALHIDVSEA